MVGASLALLVWRAGGNGVPSASAGNSSDGQFDITLLPPNFRRGTVTGVLTGRTQAEFRLLGTDRATWRLSSAWSVDAGANSFVAQFQGVYNTKTSLSSRVILMLTVSTLDSGTQ